MKRIVVILLLAVMLMQYLPQAGVMRADTSMYDLESRVKVMVPAGERVSIVGIQTIACQIEWGGYTGWVPCKRLIMWRL